MQLIEERAFWLAWSQVAGIGPILLLRLQRHFGTLAIAWDASPSELEAVDGLGSQTAMAVAKRRSQIDPDILLTQHEHDNPCFWTPADADYPRLLLEIPDPPPVLYYRGEVNRSENRGLTAAIAMVGTRNPSEYGRKWTRKITTALVNAGFTIVSGLAEGVDTEVHRQCLSLNGRTIAVLGTGVDVVYPWSNRGLAEKVEQTGLMLSEYPAGTQPDRANFPRRNRIIAGLCRATLVLEAPQRSGALITARLANDYGRDVYALPGSLDNPRSKGCLELLNFGAHLILGTDELLETLGALPQFNPPPSETTQLPLLELPPQLASVLQPISADPMAIDGIVAAASLPTDEVLSALVQLELMGLVNQLPGMRYQRA